MGKVKIVISLAAFYICLLLLPASSYAETNGQIQLEDKLDIQTPENFRIPITNRSIELMGPEQETTFYYEINSKPTADDNQFVLHMKHSELLIAPSSVTIYVDNEPVLSKPIDGEQLIDTIIVPLKGKALEEGFHSVKVSFYGVIKEGVCVAQESSGNWLALGIESYFQISGEQQEQLTLSDYPDRFVGTEKRPVAIILPNDPSVATLDSGLKVAAYLAEQAPEENTVTLIRESEVEKIVGNVIFIGARAEFQTAFMKDLMQKAKLPEAQEALVLARHALIDKEQRVEALFVTGDSPEEIEKRLAVLIIDPFIKQLSGQQMVIETIPEISQEQAGQIVPVKRFGVPNITLDRFEPASEQFFYYAPAAIQPDGKATLELHLKRSETIVPLADIQSDEALIESDVELTILVNGVPHSVDMRALTDAENGVYTVQIPIDAEQINENRLVSIQFTSSGLQKKNPCIATDQNRWIYIADDSFFTFPTGSQPDTATLANFPFPFTDLNHKTLVILPDGQSVGNRQLLSLYRALQIGGEMPQWKLAREKDLVKEDIKNHHIVFLGGPDVHPLLRDKTSDLTVPYENAIPNLVSFGFLQEAVERFSWIQSSPWNDKQSMIVFDRLDQSTPYIDKEIVEFLKTTDEVATVAVKMNNKQVYTNASQLETNSVGAKEAGETVKEQQLSMWWMIGFVALFIFTIVVILFMLRKQKRKEL